MKIISADYVKSAPSLKDCPDFGGKPEIVLVGRSNVGKSSFINSLLQRKNLARTSNTPGKTRYMNFYDTVVSRSKEGQRIPVVFVDLPGYGYAKVSKTEQEQWRKNFENYLAKREAIRLVIQLVDGRHGAQDSDISMFEFLQYHGRRVQVIMTKADKVSRNELASNTAKSAKGMDASAADLMPYSSESHIYRDATWQMIMAAVEAPVVPREQVEDDEDEE